MPKIEASKLNRSLKEVLEGVKAGKRFELTRYGKVVAKIVPPNAKDPKPDPTLAYIDHIQEIHDEGKRQAAKSMSPDEIRAKRRAFLQRAYTPPDPE